MQDKTWYSILGLDAEPLFLQDRMLNIFYFKNRKFSSKIFKPIALRKSRLQQRQMECTCKKPWNVLLEQKPTRQFQFLSFFLFVLLESLLSFLIVVATILKVQAPILTRFKICIKQKCTFKCSTIVGPANNI